MLFVEWLGSLRREDRLIVGKISRDRLRHNRCWPPRRFCARRRQSRALILILILTLSLILGDRFARKQDWLITRGRSVIVVATGQSRRRRSLESRVRPSASRTVAAAKTVVPRFDTWFDTWITAAFCAHFATRFASNVAAICARAASAPVSGFSATTATATTSTEVARSNRGVARHVRRGRFRGFALARYASGFGKLPFTMNRRPTCFQTEARSRLRHRTIRRDRFIQVLVLLFQIHEVGDVQKRVAFQSDIHKGRLHAWQHARYPALVNRAC